MSSTVYSVGEEIRGNGRDKVDALIESELEARRPGTALCRRDAVFSLEHMDFSVCGVVTPGYVYQIKPNDEPQRRDFAWIGEMQKALLRLKYTQFEGMKKYPEWNVNLIEKCCAGYWSGAATLEPGWEFLMSSCTVIDVLASELVDPKSTKGGWRPKGETS